MKPGYYLSLQVLQARVEKVITEFNLAMEESESKMERLKSTVMREAKAMIASLEDAEARRQQELGMRINKVIESLTGDMELEAMGHQEEELRQFAASHTSYALHQGHTRNHKDYS